MAKFKNLNPTGVTVGRRHGGRLFVNAGQVIEVEDAEFIERLEARGDFQKVEEVVEHNTGAGLKTHIREPKVHSEPVRESKKQKVDCPKGSYKCKGACKCDTVKKPKGLKKSKRAD